MTNNKIKILKDMIQSWKYGRQPKEGLYIVNIIQAIEHLFEEEFKAGEIKKSPDKRGLKY